MSNTRNSKSPGVFAADASTTIPSTPSLGVAYRDLTTSTAETQGGWPFGTKVFSDKFNQIMHEISALMAILDVQGMLGWCNAVDYATNAYALGSDGNLYRSLTASGPSSTPADPVSSPTNWARFGGFAASSAEVRAGIVPDKFVSPASLVAGFDSSQGASGWQKLPGGLIIQWGTIGPYFAEGALTVALPMTFPNAALNATATLLNSAADSGMDQGAQVVSVTASSITIYAQYFGGGVQRWPTSAYWMAIGR